MWQVPLEIGGIALSVFGMVEQGVDVMEDVPLGDCVVAVVGAELCQCPIGDVFAAVPPVLIVGVEGEALRFLKYVKSRNQRNHQVVKRFVTSNSRDTNYSIFRLGLGSWENSIL